MTKNGHGDKQHRELMFGANQYVMYPCPLTSEPEARTCVYSLGRPVYATSVYRG